MQPYFLRQGACSSKRALLLLPRVLERARAVSFVCSDRSEPKLTPKALPPRRASFLAKKNLPTASSAAMALCATCTSRTFHDVARLLRPLCKDTVKSFFRLDLTLPRFRVVAHRAGWPCRAFRRRLAPRRLAVRAQLRLGSGRGRRRRGGCAHKTPDAHRTAGPSQALAVAAHETLCPGADAARRDGSRASGACYS